MLTLDGSYLEGGGALVRTALALSVLTAKEFKVTNIRKGRRDPGLKAQHLTAIMALRELCNAETNQIVLGSTELHFKPGKIKGGIFDIDIGTAGSITLLLQALILPCLFAPKKVTLRISGGTCGKWQASVDYLQNILLPQLQRFVEKIELKIEKRGYYPKGGGHVILEIYPRFKQEEFASFENFCEELQYKIAKINLAKQGTLEQIKGVVNLSLELQEQQVGERIKQMTEGNLREFEVPINLRVEYANALSVGGEALIWGVFSTNGAVDFDNPVLLTGDALLEVHKPAADVAKEAVQELKQEIENNAAVDHHLADQLILYMGLLPGSAIRASEVSQHTETNIYVVEQFLPVGFTVKGTTIMAASR